MNYYRPAAERGRANFGWLDSKHTFSFGSYYDPRHMGFGALRVINDDRVAPGGGFPTHGHSNMEIISVVLSGGLSHKDSMGNGSTIVPGDVQRMSAGTGIRHSEFNASDTDPVHFLQIWIEPRADGLAPGYEQKHFNREEKLDRLRLLVSADGRDNSLVLNQDASLYGAVLTGGSTLTHRVAADTRVWIHVTSGDITVNDQRLVEGDGLGVEDSAALQFTAAVESEFLVFELGEAT